MTPDELKTNLGTLAKSGTTDFLARAESQDATGTGNLIGAFGLGFYSRCSKSSHERTTADTRLLQFPRS